MADESAACVIMLRPNATVMPLQRRWIEGTAPKPTFRCDVIDGSMEPRRNPPSGAV